MLLRTAGILALAHVALAAPGSKGQHERRPLTFGPDGKFQIALIEDLHYGEGKPHPSQITRVVYILNQSHAQYPVANITVNV